MNDAIRPRLSVMMFLEYVIWGAWLPLLNLYLDKYLHFGTGERAWIFNAFAIASLTGMFFGGQLADRYFSQEKFLAFSHLIGGLAMLGLAYVKTFWPFFGLMLLHCFFYVPTLSVTNAIAFANLKDAQKDFGKIRVWGTIGWIAASWPCIFIPIDWSRVPSLAQSSGFVSWLGTVLTTTKTGSAMEAALTSTFIVSALASLALAAFCVLLPHTPAARNQGSAFAPLEAFRLLAIGSILVLFIVTLLDSLVHYCYFIWTGSFLSDLGFPENWIQPAMSLGQIAEIATMAFLGFFLKRLGWRTTMILGILGQTVRFGIYSVAATSQAHWAIWAVILSNVVHGFAYAFFFATVYIFVDESFPKDVRTSAQSLFNILILGVGQILANHLWTWLGDALSTRTPDGVKHVDFSKLFLGPFICSLIGAAILAIFFHPKERQTADLEAEPALAQ